MPPRFRKFIQNLELRLASSLLRRISRDVAAGGSIPANFHSDLLSLALKTGPVHAPVDLSSTRIAEIRNLLLAHLPREAWPLIPSLEKRSAPVMNTWAYQNEVMQWNIAEGDLVLDIGSGGWPFQRADHLADKYPDATTHRVEHLKRDQRPFFQVDLESLPFRDKAYDFVFCSHVLEHLESPGLAIRELTRIAHRGYIEVPTRLSDIMFNFTRIHDHHRWHGLMVGQTLLLIEWCQNERYDVGNDYFDELHSPFSSKFQGFFERNRRLFFASYQWEEKIDFVVINRDGQIIDSSE